MPAARSSVADTRGRLLAAAARVFARDVLSGDTTRAIAEEARVNEVTLFRHFRTKDGLLAAVVGENFGIPATGHQAPLPEPTADLRADLLALGRHYETLLTDNLPLVRTMIGEIHHHHRDHERQVFRAIFRPVKAALVTRLEAAQAAGGLRNEFAPDLLADLLGGMIFTGVIRRASKDIKLGYSASTHLAAAVDLTLRGATAATEGSPA